MGTVVSLSAYKKSRAKKHVVTEDAEFKLFFEGLISQWQYEDNKNNINSFIADKLQIEEQLFLTDLNAVAELEADTGLTICITSPTYSDNDGWIASFVIGETIYSSIEVETETKARLFCVLLYHALMEAASNACKK
jgi:hypothetical protein